MVSVFDQNDFIGKTTIYKEHLPSYQFSLQGSNPHEFRKVIHRSELGSHTGALPPVAVQVLKFE